MRDYGICLSEGYTADQYAAAWADGLYSQLFDCAMESFWYDYGYENYKEDDVEEMADYITVSKDAETEARLMCYQAYKEAYLRYEREANDDIDNFEEWEVDETAIDVIGVICADLFNQVEQYKKYGEIKE